MKLKFITKQDGSLSRENIVSAVVFLVGALEIIKPIIPTQYLPYFLVFLAVLYYYLRKTSNGSPIA